MPISAIRVGDILYWGESKGFLTQEELSLVSLSRESTLHLLRHLKSLRSGWSLEGFSKIEIEGRLNQPGSHWNPHAGFDTPERVFNFCIAVLKEELRQGEKPMWIAQAHRNDQVDRLLFSCVVAPALKEKFGCPPNAPLGTQGIAHVSDVQKDTLKIVQRGEERASVMVGSALLPTTDQVVICLKREGGKQISLWTAFPGLLTPRHPDPNQLPEEQEYSKNFWEEYVLLNPE